MLEALSAHFGEASLAALFIYSFLSATLLPGGSEVALGAVLLAQPASFWTPLLLATVGNTLGGMTSYACGRWLPQRPTVMDSRAGRAMHRYGAPALLLSWVPIIGDLLCVAAGWLRVHWLVSALAIAVGKFVRYWVVAVAVARYST
jgi:membrane protein YqaA with SNARE-associated domain